MAGKSSYSIRSLAVFCSGMSLEKTNMIVVMLSLSDDDGRQQLFDDAHACVEH